MSTSKEQIQLLRLSYVKSLVIPTILWNLSDECDNDLRSWILPTGATLDQAMFDEAKNCFELSEDIRLFHNFGVACCKSDSASLSSWTSHQVIDYDASCLQRKFLTEYFYDENRVTPCGIRGFNGKKIEHISAEAEDGDPGEQPWQAILSRYGHGKEFSALLLNPPGPLDQLSRSKEYFAGKVLLNSKELKKKFPKFSWPKFGHDFITLGSYETQYHFDHLGKVL
jgi:hypothetical protein